MNIHPSHTPCEIETLPPITMCDACKTETAAGLAAPCPAVTTAGKRAAFFTQRDVQVNGKTLTYDELREVLVLLADASETNSLAALATTRTVRRMAEDAFRQASLVCDMLSNHADRLPPEPLIETTKPQKSAEVRKTAQERANELFNTPEKDVPLKARAWRVRMGRRHGICSEVTLAAYADYAEVLEGLHRPFDEQAPSETRFALENMTEDAALHTV